MGELALVSGATGYLGSWVCKAFLDAGFRVRGTVRSVKDKSKLIHLQRLIDDGAELELVEADLLDEGSWPAACAGCSVVAHVASPFVVGVTKRDAEEKLFKPARDGTLNVLRAAQAAGTVRRVVLTSSTAAIASGRKFSWPVENPEQEWGDLEHADTYSQSKILAERAAWDFVSHQKDAGVPVFELVTLNPNFFVGPPLGPAWATSHQVPRTILFREVPCLGDIYMGVVDVRDVALAHARAAIVKEAGGKRFCLHAGCLHQMEWSRLLGAEFKQWGYKSISLQAPKWLFWLASKVNADFAVLYPDVGVGPKELICTQAKEVLGIDFRNPSESVVEHAHGCFAVGVSGFKLKPRYRAYMNARGPFDAGSTRAADF